MADCNGLVIELQVRGPAPTSLEVSAPDYWFVMFNKLAYDKIVTPPVAPAPAPQFPSFTPAPAPARSIDPDSKSTTVPPPALLGRWISIDNSVKTIEFTADGTFVLLLPDGEKQSGRFTTVDSTLTLEVSDTMRSTFTWSVAGNELDLKRENGSTSAYRRA